MAKASIYQTTKAFLHSRPGEYFTSESVREGLNLKEGGKGADVSKMLAALAKGKGGIDRRANAEGRYEYAYTGETAAGEEPPAEKPARGRRRKAAQPAKRRGRRAGQRGTRLAPTARSAATAPSEPRSPGGGTGSSIRNLANFIRAYLDLSPQEQREAVEWLKSSG